MAEGAEASGTAPAEAQLAGPAPKAYMQLDQTHQLQKHSHLTWLSHTDSDLHVETDAEV